MLWCVACSDLITVSPSTTTIARQSLLVVFVCYTKGEWSDDGDLNDYLAPTFAKKYDIGKLQLRSVHN